MKITSVTAIPASAAPRGQARNYMFVKIETDEGINGWGEATSGPLAVASMVEEFGRSAQSARTRTASRSTGRRSIITFMCAEV